MATETEPTTEGQAKSEEMTLEELENRIQTDPAFATDFLDGKVKVEEEPVAATEAVEPTAEAAIPAPVVEAEVKLEPAPAKDEEFIVEMPEGKILKFPNANHGKKAIREGQLFIQRQKEIIADKERHEQELSAQLEALRKATPAAVAAPVTKTEQAVAVESEKELDPFSEDYLKQLGVKLAAQEAETKRLREAQAAYEADRDSWKKKDEERETEVKRQNELRRQFLDADHFVHAHEEFKLGKPVEVINDEYKEFLSDLGKISGTNGSLAANVNAANLYFDADNPNGKSLKEKAEAHGVRPPADIDKYFVLARLMNEQKRLKRYDPDLQKEVAFTLEETYHFLQASNGDLLASTHKVESKPAQAATPAIDPRAAAIQEAARRANEVATDIPPGASSAAIDVSAMSIEQKMAIFDWPKERVMRDVNSRNTYIDVYRSIGQEPPKWALGEIKPITKKG